MERFDDDEVSAQEGRRAGAMTNRKNCGHLMHLSLECAVGVFVGADRGVWGHGTLGMYRSNPVKPGFPIAAQSSMAVKYIPEHGGTFFFGVAVYNYCAMQLQSVNLSRMHTAVPLITTNVVCPSLVPQGRSAVCEI